MKRIVLLGLLTTGCATEPPVVDRSRPSYQADLQACQDSVPSAVNARNAKIGLDWFSSPVRRPFQIRTGMRDCMTAKGYTLGS